MEKKEEKIFRDIVKILEQDVPQEALAEGNPTPEQEAIALIKQELDRAREEGRREGSEITSRYISDFVKSESGKSGRKEILEYIEELSKLKQ